MPWLIITAVIATWFLGWVAVVVVGSYFSPKEKSSLMGSMGAFWPVLIPLGIIFLLPAMFMCWAADLAEAAGQRRQDRIRERARTIANAREDLDRFFDQPNV